MDRQYRLDKRLSDVCFRNMVAWPLGTRVRTAERRLSLVRRIVQDIVLG
jgi:hypothetical protein